MKELKPREMQPGDRIRFVDGSQDYLTIRRIESPEQAGDVVWTVYGIDSLGRVVWFHCGSESKHQLLWRASLHLLLEGFVSLSEPEECGCEFEHVHNCHTMRWRRQLRWLEAAVASSDAIAEAVARLRNAKGWAATAQCIEELSELSKKHHELILVGNQKEGGRPEYPPEDNGGGVFDDPEGVRS